MSQRERQLARLLRALIACCALLFAFEAPASAAGAAREASGWIAERVASALVSRAPARAGRAPRRAARQQRNLPAPVLAHAAPQVRSECVAPAGRRTAFDARHLYLDLETLLC
jgi:hypothetical protein